MQTAKESGQNIFQNHLLFAVFFLYVLRGKGDGVKTPLYMLYGM